MESSQKKKISLKKLADKIKRIEKEKELLTQMREVPTNKYTNKKM